METTRMLTRIVLMSFALVAAAPALAQQASADRHDAALAWAQCIRDNDYTDFPDPDAEGGFQFLIDRDKGELFRTATEACRDLAPEGMRDDGVTPEQLDVLIKTSQCIRENGVPNFPDPGSKGNFDVSGLGIEPGDSRLETAMAKCQPEGGTTSIRITIGG